MRNSQKHIHEKINTLKEIPSYVKDINDFLYKMKDINKVPEETYLVTMDVECCYTNITNSESIAATRKALDKRTIKTVATKVITTVLALLLALNNFIFNCKNYLQIKGSAMGTICEPFMADFEIKHQLIKNLLCFTYDTLIISLIYGKEQTTKY